MEGNEGIRRSRFRTYGRGSLSRLQQWEKLSGDQRDAVLAASAVLPFKVNDYVLNELIDWDDIPNDPIYQLTFPQAGMLASADFNRLADLVADDDTESLRRTARKIQDRMNPHPAGQMNLNVPTMDGRALVGLQHKYRETVLFFPSQGQTCHAYCTYCFRWAQFVGVDHLWFATNDAETLGDYIATHTEVSDLLVTGGDPLIMGTRLLRRHVSRLLEPGMEHLTSIRFGTKALSYWPYRFLTDADADDLLRPF